jgi:hypothetical protein
MPKIGLAGGVMLAGAMLACSSLGLIVPTGTPFPTATATRPLTLEVFPTDTQQPATETPDIIASLIPAGTPAQQWKGIPIMPGALAGEGDDRGYQFTIRATPEHVKEFYTTGLEKLGWQLWARGEGKTFTVMLIFMRGNENLSITMIPKGDLMLVMLVR